MNKDLLKAFCDPKVVEALKKGNHIKPETYEKLKKYADGGEVTMPSSVPEAALQFASTVVPAEIDAIKSAASSVGDFIKNAPTIPSYSSSQAEAKPQEQVVAEKVEKAKENTAAQSGSAPAPAQYQMEKATPTHDKYMDMVSGTIDSVQKGYETGFGQMAKGVKEGAAAGAKEAAATGAYLQNVTHKLEDIEQTRQRMEQDRQARSKEQVDKLDKMNQDFMQTASIDPNRYWSSKSTGQKVMASIGMALGGLGGHGNQAIDVLKSAIDRDVDAQKTDMEKKRIGLQGQQNVYKMMLDQFGDQRAAESATKASLLNIAEMQVKQIAAQYQGPKIQAEAQKLLGNIALEKGKAAQEFMGFVKTSAGMMSADKMDRDIQMRVPKELQAEAMKERGEWDKHNKVKQGVSEAMETMFDNRRNLIPGTSGHNVAEAAKAKIKTLTSELFGGKSEQEFKLIEPMLPTWKDSPDDFKFKMDQIQQKLDSQASFPILQGKGILPKQLDLRKN
jgi:hypothetical protein